MRVSFSFVCLLLDALAGAVFFSLPLGPPFGSWRSVRASRELCRSATWLSSYPALLALSNERELRPPIRYYGPQRVRVRDSRLLRSRRYFPSTLSCRRSIPPSHLPLRAPPAGSAASPSPRLPREGQRLAARATARRVPAAHPSDARPAIPEQGSHSP